MIYGKNRPSKEIDNIDCDIDVDFKRYADKYIKIVNDKQVLIYSVSESFDKLMKGLDVNTSNDIATKEIKDFKKVVNKKQKLNKQKLIKQRYKSLLETKKTIKNNIELIYSALKKLPNESQPKLTELFRLDTILNDSINIMWREIYERGKKGIKKIDVNKIKNVDGFIHQLNNIKNNKTVLLKTTVIVKLNRIISDLKEKSGMDDVYNYDDIDKLL